MRRSSIRSSGGVISAMFFLDTQSKTVGRTLLSAFHQTGRKVIHAAPKSIQIIEPEASFSDPLFYSNRHTKSTSCNPGKSHLLTTFLAPLHSPRALRFFPFSGGSSRP